MRMFFFSVFDRAAQAFQAPFTAPSAGIAVRSFTDAVNNRDQRTDLNSHPDDFELYQLGTFDCDTGVVYTELVEDLQKPLFLSAAKHVAQPDHPFRSSAVLDLSSTHGKSVSVGVSRSRKKS